MVPTPEAIRWTIPSETKHRYAIPRRDVGSTRTCHVLLQHQRQECLPQPVDCD